MCSLMPAAERTAVRSTSPVRVLSLLQPWSCIQPCGNVPDYSSNTEAFQQITKLTAAVAPETFDSMFTVCIAH